MFTGAANNFGKLVSVVSQMKSAPATCTTCSSVRPVKEPENDDWLFCKRLYNKLQNMPDGQAKEYFKLNTDTEALRMTFMCNAYGNPSTIQHTAASQNQQAMGGYDDANHGERYMQL